MSSASATALMRPGSLGSRACQELHSFDALLLINPQNSFLEQRPKRLNTPSAYTFTGNTIGPGSRPLPRSARVIDVMNTWIALFGVHSRGLNVYVSLDYHPPDHCSFCDISRGGINTGTYCVRGISHDLEIYVPSFNVSHRCLDSVSIADYQTAGYFQWPAHCVAGTLDARVDPYLQVPPDARVVKLGVQAMYDDYSAMDSRVSVAAPGAHDNQTNSQAALAPSSQSLGTLLAAAGTQRLIVMGLATGNDETNTVRRSVQDALGNLNISVALAVAGTAGTTYSVDLLKTELETHPLGYALTASSPQEAMKELCASTCDLGTGDAAGGHVYCPSKQYCKAKFATPEWGVCKDCDCDWLNGRTTACDLAGACICQWPAWGARCTDGYSQVEYVLLIVFPSVIGFLLLVAALFMWLERRRKKRRRQLLLRTSKRHKPSSPELTLAEGHEWHLFLSHVWSSGQDQVAVIFRRIKELMPKARVFLDVEVCRDMALEPLPSPGTHLLTSRAIGCPDDVNRRR